MAVASGEDCTSEEVEPYRYLAVLRISITVNGKVVNSLTRSSLTRGKIMFQTELAEIYFRKIELRPLPRKG